MSDDRRYRDGADREGRDADGGSDGVWPGKRSATTPRGRRGPGDPGKRTVSSSLSPPSQAGGQGSGQNVEDLSIQPARPRFPSLFSDAASAREPAHPHDKPRTPREVTDRLGEGSSVDGTVAAKVGKAWGQPVAHARVHVDAGAAELASQFGAQAVTLGSDIAFASGAYQPNTPQGDTLIAHELAHVVQQRGAGGDLDAPLQLSDRALEHDADHAAHGATQTHAAHGETQSHAAKPLSPALASGLRLAANPLAVIHSLGSWAVLDVRPDVIDGDPAIVGMMLHCAVRRDRIVDDEPIVRTWDMIEPSGSHFSYMSQEMADFPIKQAGWHELRVEMLATESNRTWMTSWRFNAVKKEDRTKDLLPKVADTSFEDLRGQWEVQQALLRPPDADKQASGDYRIFTLAANPQPMMPSDLYPPILFQIQRTVSGPQTPGTNYQWYIKPLNAPKGRHRNGTWALGNMRSTSLDGTSGFFDAGSGEFAKIPSDENNVFIVVCRVLDGKGQRLSEARYIQTVLTSEEQKDFEKFEAYRERAEKLGDSIDESSRTVLNAIHVATDSTRAKRPLLVVGLTASGVKLVDLTPGLEPKDNTLEFYGKDLDEVLAKFKDQNKYPTGHLRVQVPANNKLGAGGAPVPVKSYEFETTGESDLEGWSGRFGLASLALLVGAVVAAPFTGGGSVVVSLLLIGSAVTGVIAGGLSLAERLRHAEISPTGVALDIVGIVGSLVGGAAAFRGLSAGSQAINVAGQATRFVLWTNFVTSSIAAVLVSVEGVKQIQEILASDMPAGDKAALLLRVVTTMAMTGAILALSYKDMTAVRNRLSGLLGSQLEGALTGEARFTLNLLDESALKAMSAGAKSATAEELTRLAQIIRRDPQLVARLAGRTDLLDILRVTRGDTVDAFELGMMRNRMTPRFGAAHAERVATALESAGVSGRAANGLGDEALARIASDPERAGALYHQYGDEFLQSLRTSPAEPFDKLADKLAKAHPDAAKPGVFDMTNTRNVTLPKGDVAVDGNLSPNNLNSKLRGMNSQERIKGAKVAFSPRAGGKGAPLQTTGHITVNDAHGAPMTIDVEVKSTGGIDTPGGAAGTEPSRLDLLPPDPSAGRPNWQAKVTVSNRVREDDVASIVGRELDEAIDIAARGEAKTIGAEQRSIAFAPGARVPTNSAAVSSADRATLRQLDDLYADLKHEQEVLAGHERAGTATPAMRARVEEQAQRVERLLRSMGLDQPQRFAERLDLLRQLGVPEKQLKPMQVFIEQRAFAAGTHPGMTSTQPVITGDVIDHLLHVKPTGAGTFVTNGLYGGHETNNLRQFLANNPEFELVQTRATSSGGTTYREYQQYRWKGTGAPPPIGDARRPGKSGFVAADWDVASVPKTSADSLQPYLHGAEAAWEGWRSSNFVPGKPPTGLAAQADGRFTTAPIGGVAFEGGFKFTSGPPARWTLNTIYPKL